MTSRTSSPALSAGAGAARASTPGGARKGQGAQTPARPAGATATPTASAPKSAASSSSSPAPPPSGSAIVPDLSELLNLPLRVGVVAGEAGGSASTVEGSLFTYDSSFVVLASNPHSTPITSTSPPPPPPPPPSTAAPSGATGPSRTFTFLRTSQITSVSVLSSSPTDPSLPALATTTPSSGSLPPLPCTPAELSTRVDRAVAEDRRARARLAPAGAGTDAQGLYDALAKTLPVRWAATSIVVLDEVVIESPYEPHNVKGAKGSADRVERVKKMVEGLRARLGMVTPSG
ncbi:hypothetical protein JCM3774_004123 [Rhodotorula dairenensis]